MESKPTSTASDPLDSQDTLKFLFKSSLLIEVIFQFAFRTIAAGYISPKDIHNTLTRPYSDLAFAKTNLPQECIS
jgi:hypothetical protein